MRILPCRFCLAAQILAILACPWLVARLASQTPDGFSMFKVAGTTIAAEYNHWSLTVATPITTTGTIVTVSPEDARIDLPGGPSLSPLRSNAPLLVTDPNGDNEVIQPQAVMPCPTNAAQICFQAVFAHTHPAQFRLSSATAGLQEAINATAEGGGGTVLVTPAWQGTTAQILTAQIPSNVLVRDVRAGKAIWYSSQPGEPAPLLTLDPATHTVTVGGSLASRSLENVFYPEGFAGADAGAKINACLLAAQPLSGICDARALTSVDGVWNENIFNGVTAPFVLLLGASYQRIYAPQIITAYGIIRGSGPLSVLEGHAAGPMITELYGSLQTASYPLQPMPGIRDLALLGINQTGSTGLQLGSMPSPTNISSLSRSSNVVTVVTSTPHSLVNDSWATVSGALDGSFDGDVFPITVTSATSFTFPQNGPNATSSGGAVEQQGGAPGAMFSGVSVRKFDTGIEVASNSYGDEFDHVVMEANLTNDLHADDSAGLYSNWAEQITCVACFIADAPHLLNINSGTSGADFNFVNSSFDQGTVTIAGMPVVGLTNPHIEGFPADPMVNISGGMLTITGGEWVSDSPSPVAISSIARVSNTVTVTVLTPGWSSKGSRVVVAGVSDASFDGAFPIITIGPNTFTYADVGPDATSSGGSATMDWPAYITTSGTAAVNVYGTTVESFGSHLDAFVNWASSGALDLHGNTPVPSSGFDAWASGFSSSSHGSVEDPLRNTFTLARPLLAPSLQLDGDAAQTSQTRAVFTAFLPTTTAAGTWAQISFDKPILVTRLDAFAQGGTVAGCTSSASISLVQNGVAMATIILGNGAQSWDESTALNLSASTPLTVAIGSAALDCTVAPANVTLQVQYRMQ